MKNAAILVLLLATAATAAFAQHASELPASVQIQPEDLLRTLQSTKGEKPLVLQVGPKLLYDSNHIVGSEHMGPASTPEGLATLRARVKGLRKDKAIVLYCGCCPWEHCPNEYPAYEALKSLGFTDVKVLYLAQNFHTNWIAKGYPTEKGH